MTVMNWRWPTPDGRLPATVPLVAIGMMLVLAASAWLIELSPVRLWQAGPRLIAFAGHLFTTPDWDYVPRLAEKMLETIEMTVLATFLALLLAFPLGILAAHNASPHPIVFQIARTALSFIRALPDMVVALLFVSALGLGALPGILALALVTVGFMGKFIAEAIEVVGTRAIEGLSAVGAGRWQRIQYAMLPQAMPDFIGSLLYILDHNLRAAAVLGLVGAGGIGYDLVMAMRLFDYGRISLIALSIYVVVTLLDRASAWLRAQVLGRMVNVH